MVKSSRELAAYRPPRSAAERLRRLFLTQPSPHTNAAYAQDLACYRRFTGQRTVTAAIGEFLAYPPGEANAVAVEYIGWLRMSGYAPSTVARRIAALKSLARHARTCGLIHWTIDTRVPHSKRIRDTRGPGPEGVARLLEAALARADAVGLRDFAMIHVCRDLALRASEALGLDIGHVELGTAQPGQAGRCHVRHKGDTDRRWRTLPHETAEAMARWLAERGPGPAGEPVFCRIARDKAGAVRGRLSLCGWAARLAELSRRAGIARCRPHGLRHEATTTALRLTGGNVRLVQQFTGHRSAETVARYDDERRDMAGLVAELVASGTSWREQDGLSRDN